VSAQGLPGSHAVPFRMDLEKLIALVKRNPSIYDASNINHRSRKYIENVWAKIGQEMGVGELSFIFIYFFFLYKILIKKIIRIIITA
jgi:hypothetical protein